MSFLAHTLLLADSCIRVVAAVDLASQVSRSPPAPPIAIQALLVEAATLPSGPGGGVLDRPTESGGTPGRESEFDVK